MRRNPTLKQRILLRLGKEWITGEQLYGLVGGDRERLSYVLNKMRREGVVERKEEPAFHKAERVKWRLRL